MSDNKIAMYDLNFIFGVCMFSQTFENQDHCQVCFDYGELLLCQYCPAAYHLSCCPNSYCEDCVPPDVEFLEHVARWDHLGFSYPRNCCYIRCVISLCFVL
jgi:hypothetical protein